MGKQTSASRLADIEHVLESFRAAVVGVRYLRTFGGARIEIAQQVDLGSRLIVGRDALQVAQVGAVGSEHVIELGEGTRDEVPSAPVEPIASPEPGSSCAKVDRF